MAKLFDECPAEIVAWKAQLQEDAAEVVGSGAGGTETAPVVDLKLLRAKLGELTLEKDFLSGALSKGKRRFGALHSRCGLNVLVQLQARCLEMAVWTIFRTKRGWDTGGLRF